MITHPSISACGHGSASTSQPLQPRFSTVDSLPFTRFIWGAGIECSVLPHLDVDQFNWTQHDRFWKEDFRRARAELGISHLRYCFPWHILQPRRGRFEWAFADQRMEELDRLGIKLLLDVVHFGTPIWLKQAVGDPEFPEALQELTEAMVARYRRNVAAWCPFNEPLVSALFSGDFGFWPPHSRKWRGYMPVLSRVVQGVSRGIRAIRNTAPEAAILLCDAAENYKSRSKALNREVRLRNLRRFVVMDLLTGRVDRAHPLFDWLNSYGMSELDLEWFRSNPQSPDILGLDYYTHSDWQLDLHGDSVRQRRADNPAGFYTVANAYYNRYGLPIMLTETSVEGQPLNREIWFETLVEHTRRLREQGVPMLGMIWWPMIDQVDWDGALTHRVGKIHQVGLFNLQRQPDGVMARKPTPLVDIFRRYASRGDAPVGTLESVAYPVDSEDEQLPPLQVTAPPALIDRPEAILAPSTGNTTSGKDGGNGNGAAVASPAIASRITEPAPGLASEITGADSDLQTDSPAISRAEIETSTDRYGIVVFSHLRWGFVWQRPQQFLSRFAKKHDVLFIEEPMFDLAEGKPPRLEMHRVMPNVTVATPHCSHSWNRNPRLPDKLLDWTSEAIANMNETGAFDRPLLWYYSPMDSSWSLGRIENRGIVYDCMDELSQFTGAPGTLVENEARLMRYADIVFTGGYNLGDKKRKQHGNVHVFGCGVEFAHFAKAMDANTAVPPDIDFMARPILGWFGVVDERLDYAMISEVARMRTDWSLAFVGPVVKVDPNLLPHNPNLFWMGGRDYQMLPNYCNAFDICVMPFAMNASTEYINPTKGLEYMATGRPIISTPVRDVVKQWSDVIAIASNADQFVAHADRFLREGAQDRVARGLDLARSCSWENTVATMQGLIRGAISKKDRPSARNIAPMTEAQLEYLYVPTPGS